MTIHAGRGFEHRHKTRDARCPPASPSLPIFILVLIIISGLIGAFLIGIVLSPLRNLLSGTFATVKLQTI